VARKYMSRHSSAHIYQVEISEIEGGVPVSLLFPPTND
jgi:hypothetical protein